MAVLSKMNVMPKLRFQAKITQNDRVDWYFFSVFWTMITPLKACGFRVLYCRLKKMHFIARWQFSWFAETVPAPYLHFHLNLPLTDAGIKWEALFQWLTRNSDDLWALSFLLRRKITYRVRNTLFLPLYIVHNYVVESGWLELHVLKIPRCSR